MCWANSLASERKQVTNLFEGDTLAVLNEEQMEILDFVMNLLIENDSVVILPQEINLLVGDTIKDHYLAYPDWKSAYYQKDSKNNQLIVPTYAKTPLGIVKSQIVVEQKKSDKYKCLIETQISTSIDEASFTGSYMESNIQGTFLRGKLYNKGVVVGEIEGEKQNKVAIYCKGKYHKKPTTQNIETLQIFKSDIWEQLIPEKNGIIMQWFE